MKFISKPVVIEAIPFSKDHPAVTELEDGRFYVKGKQGWARVFEHDWIITEPNPEDGHYPCNRDVFAMKYDPLKHLTIQTAEITADGEQVIREVFDVGFNAVAEFRA